MTTSISIKRPGAARRRGRFGGQRFVADSHLHGFGHGGRHSHRRPGRPPAQPTMPHFTSVFMSGHALWNRSVTAGAGHGQRLPRLRPLRLALRILPGRLPVRRPPVHAGQGPCQAIRPRMEPRLGRPLLANSLRRPHSR
ncbi:hypothetical protein DAPPUDRAFT_119591 [Daphnia pulex]|uniref:Uncharacterized protein n=1 Tax=Daphnia pulex TaxID=6669 RepID=E9HYZ2_DAPPU|nr:hypothetical protein DAPPUDRAFT_119591 [Daphnia pulex]|eukprot:EFX63039.1 hypothetical protein DAPPUDRAFT_119591 [Daphnia pulex]